MNKPAYQILEWDSAFFGFKIARATSSTFCADDSGFLASVKEDGVECLYFLTSPDCPVTLNAMQQFGCQFIDGRLSFSLDMQGGRFEANAATDVYLAESGDSPAIEAIAADSHRDTRFFKDSRFPEARSQALYREWIRRDLEEGRVLVARSGRLNGGSVLGYLSYSISSETAESQISLIAVSPEARGKGIGNSLVSSAISLFHERGCVSCLIVTQASNIIAQRLYQGFGFRSISLGLWYHKWF